MDIKYSDVTVIMPDEPYRLEEANLPPTLARSLAGRALTVQVLPEEQPGTRPLDPDAPEPTGWIDPEGNLWNDYHPMQVLFADPDEGKVWHFPRRWLGPPVSEFALDSSYSVSQEIIWTEKLHMPSTWDMWEINIEMSEAFEASGEVATIEVCASPHEPVKVLWRDTSGTLWRIPHDWRRRRIRLPGYDVLVSQDIPAEVAQEYAGNVVSVNYHPGSVCCLPDGYRFRDGEGQRWEVKMRDCVLLGYGDEEEHNI